LAILPELVESREKNAARRSIARVERAR